MITRQAGAVPPTAAWLALAALVGSASLLLAAAVHRRGLPVHGWLVCAVTRLLVSPVSWDHHWVWIGLVLVGLTDMLPSPWLRAAPHGRPAALYRRLPVARQPR